MSVEKLQLQLIQYILKINNSSILKTFISIAKGFSNDSKNPNEADDYIHPKGVPFDIWNQQFDDAEDLEKYDKEIGMTLKEFRKTIWEAEQEKEYPIEKLYTHLNQRLDELKTKNAIQN